MTPTQNENPLVWNHKDCWKFTDNRTFTVEITRHQVKVDDHACFDSDMGHRWAVYAYIYPSHPHFAKFDETDKMWQEAAIAMPFHGGPSFFHRHVRLMGGKPETVSFHVGADYNHDGDWLYTQQAGMDDARGVFSDAEELVVWLQARAAGEVQP